MNTRIYHLVLFLFLAVAVSPAQAIARGPQGTVRVGIFQFEPLNFMDEKGVAQGLYPDLLREIVKDEDWTVTFVPGSWKESLERLQAGEIDMILSTAYSSERAKVMDFSFESVAELWGQVFLQPNSKFKNINDLDGQRVGVMRKDISGSNFITTAENLGVHSEIFEFDTHAKVFDAVQQGKVDAGVAPQHFGLRHSREYNLTGSSIMFSPFSIYFATKKGMQHELLSHIDSHLSHWKSEPDSFYYDRLGYWLGSRSSKAKIPTWVIYAATIGGFTLLLFASFLLVLKKIVTRRTKELQESETRMRLFFDRQIVGMAITSPEKNWIQVNDRLLQILGYSRKELDLLTWDELTHPDDIEHDLTQFNRVLAGDIDEYSLEKRFIRKDGNTITVIISVGCVRHEDSSVDFLAVFFNDITKRKRLEENLLQAQKMESLGSLAGGIAHDFNNILSVILGYTEMAMEECQPQSTIADNLSQVLVGANRAKGLVQQILAFSRQSDTEPIIIQPASIVKETVTMLRPYLPTTIDITQDIDTATNPILIDPTQLNQILMNLCTNAFHAMEETGGILDISLKEVQLCSEDLAHQPGVAAGNFIQISISDSGPGIPPNIKDKVFDPYFTTKNVGKGTGMGLAMVHGIVKSYAGFTTLYSELGEGTVLHVFLPVETNRKQQKDEIAEYLPTGKERILFVDDEKILTTMATTMLERLGYHVTATNSSPEALETFQKQSNTFDIVITDQTMPNMTGCELSRRMLQVRPDIPIILCTGYSSIISEEKAKAIGIKGFALKPLGQKEITTLIRKVLASS